jgi:hypothetical protein
VLNSSLIATSVSCERTNRQVRSLDGPVKISSFSGYNPRFVGTSGAVSRFDSIVFTDRRKPMKKLMIAAATAATLSLTSMAQAQDPAAGAATGAAVGAGVGAVVGGPPGAIIGGRCGALA